MTDSLQMWHAVVILVIHGIGSLFWATPSQLLIHDIVGPTQLPSAVRLNATARYLGLLAGPAVGGGILLLLGPAHGLLLNILIYLPLTLWLWKAPYGPRFPRRCAGTAARRARLRRHRADDPRHLRQSHPGIDDPARRRLLVPDRQRLSGADAGVRARLRPRRRRPALQHAAGRRRDRRVSRRHPARNPRSAAAAHAHGLPARDAVVLRHRRLRRGDVLSGGAAAAVRRGLSRAVVQRHGPDVGADPRPRRRSAAACSASTAWARWACAPSPG